MKKKDYNILFKKELEPFFNEYGFKTSIYSNDILVQRKYKDKYEYFDMVNFFTLNYRDEFPLMFSVSKNIPIAREWFKIIQNDPFLDKHYKKRKDEIIFQWLYGDYAGWGQLDRFDLANKKDAYHIINTLKQFMEDEGWNFFRKFLTLKEIDAEFNKLPLLKDSIYMPNNSYRAKYSLIIARLAKNSNFNELVSAYRDLLHEYPEKSKFEFEKYVSYLLENDISEMDVSKQ